MNTKTAHRDQFYFSIVSFSHICSTIRLNQDTSLMVQTVPDVAGTPSPQLRPACFYHSAVLLLGSASCGLIECLFLFLQFWLVDHIRSHWPAGWPLALLASWHCSTDDESFQEPHLSAQWQTLPQLLLFYPPSLSPSSSPLSVLHSSFYPFSISSFLRGWTATRDLCPSPCWFL